MSNITIPFLRITITKKNFKPLSYMCLLIGFLFLYGVFYTFFSDKHIYSTYIHAQGGIKANVPCANESNTHSLVSFLTNKQIEVDFFTSGCSNIPRFKEGESVTVLYPENDPQKAIVDTNDQKYLPSLVCVFLSFVFLSFGIITLYLKGRPGVEGMPAAIIAGVFFSLFGILLMVMGTKSWMNNIYILIMGFLLTFFGIVVMIWEKMKEFMH